MTVEAVLFDWGGSLSVHAEVDLLDTPTRQNAPMVNVDDHPAVQRVRQALRASGRPVEIRVLDESAHTAALAAQQLGVDVGQICNSLVFATGELPSAVLVLTSGAHRVDLYRAAAALGVAGLRRADAELVKAATGFSIGGVAPIGHERPVPTLLDEHLATYSKCWAAAGHPRTVFETTYADLLALTGATPAAVGRAQP